MLNIKKEEEEEEQEGNDNTTHYTTTADPSGVNTYYKILCVKDKNNNNKTVYNRLEPIDDFNYEVEFVYNYNLTTYCFARKIKRFVLVDFAGHDIIVDLRMQISLSS